MRGRFKDRQPHLLTDRIVATQLSRADAPQGDSVSDGTAFDRAKAVGKRVRALSVSRFIGSFRRSELRALRKEISRRLSI